MSVGIHWLLLVFIAGFLFGGCAWLNREKRVRHLVHTDYSVHTEEFRLSASQMLGAPLVGGNTVTELRNGDEIFPAMVDAIKGAKHSVTLETFIWSSGKVSDRFVEAIVERAKAGVKIRIIGDGFGSAALDEKDIKKMEKAGAVYVGYNHPVRLFRSNHRTHRKTMVVDGRIGFTGGVCISDKWQGKGEAPFWRETHLRVEGPVVAQMQAVFLDNWVQMRSEVLHGKDWFPELEEKGDAVAQYVKSGPREGAEMTRLGYLHSIAAARKHIRIAHAYFAPDTLMQDALIAARKRGVKVEIMVPGKIDNLVVTLASRPRWQKLLDAGVEFWEFQPTLFHLKVVVIDDVWSIVGSVNFDERSLRLNDEANLQVLDPKIAKKLIASFEDDKKRSRPITAKMLKERSFFGKLLDHFAGLFRSQL